jgi:uncharacterized protein related to proFAR isomerase
MSEGASAITGGGTTFARIPAVSIKNGRVVLARDGQYNEIQPGHPILADLPRDATPPDRKYGHTLAIFERLFMDFPTAYVLDLDGIGRNSPQLDLMRQLSERGTIWVDGGGGLAEHGMDFLMVGAEGAVIATKTARGMDEIEEATEIFEDIIVSIDYDGKLLARNRKLADMDPVDFAKEAARLGVRRFVFADYRRQGVDENMVGLLVRHCPELYVGGGVNSAHCDRLQTLGARGAVLELSDVMERLE